MYFRVLVFIAILGTFITTEAINKKNCNWGTCKEKRNINVSNRCGTVIHIGFNAKEKQKIVEYHNDLRRWVASGKENCGKPGPQPRAINMLNMEWDEGLANTAQKWANQCNFTHNPNRGYGVGENLARYRKYTSKRSYTPKKVTTLIQHWYDEVCNFDGRTVRAFPEENLLVVGHYTQVVWATTTKVGCGLIDYQNEPRKKTRYFVCNYAPAGNIPGKPVYAT